MSRRSILLDLMMPVMDGFEFLSKLREDESRRTIPVVVITAKELTSEDRERLSIGVERIFSKGAHLESILADVRRSVAASAS